MYTDGSGKKTNQSEASMPSMLQPPSTKTIQPIQSQPPAPQWRWKQSHTLSSSLPQDVTVRPHAIILTESMSLLQKVKRGMGNPNWQVPCLISTTENSWGCTALNMPESSRHVSRQSSHHKWLVI